MIRVSRCIVFVFTFCAVFLAIAQAQTTTIIRANEAAAHVGEYATVEGRRRQGLHIEKRQHVSEHRCCVS